MLAVVCGLCAGDLRGKRQQPRPIGADWRRLAGGQGLTTWLDGTVRTRQTYPGAYAGQIIERYNVGGWP
jgi:hypothetical protein